MPRQGKPGRAHLPVYVDGGGILTEASAGKSRGTLNVAPVMTGGQAVAMPAINGADCERRHDVA